MNESLLYRMRPVARRLRGLRFWQVWIVAAAVVVGIGLWLRSKAAIGMVDGREAAIALAIGSAIIAVLAAIATRFLYRDPRSIARRIETRFPSLDQRLLTALSQQDSELGYLQQRVVKEARDHSRSNAWIEAVPPGRIWISRLSGLTLTAALAAVLGVLAGTTPDTQSRAAMRISAIPTVIVEPGSTEIELGTGLLVTARFDGGVFDQGELVCVDDDGTQIVLPMRQNLDDPILGGWVASVDRAMTYQVRTPEWSSDRYRVEVFEFPKLVRSDADLTYPTYTGLEPKHIDDTVRISAVNGTTVTWTLRLNKPVAKAELVDESGERLSVEFASETSADGTVSIDLTESKKYMVSLVDASGRRNAFPPTLTMRAIANAEPKLKVTPASDSTVSPLEEFAIEVEVSDDFGIAELGLQYSLSGGTPVDLTLQSDIAARTKTVASPMIALEDIGAREDDLLAYHFYAIDTGPDGQPRRTESDMFFAEVRPLEEIFREGEPPAGSEGPPPPGNAGDADELAELQKEIINATWRVQRDVRSDANLKTLPESIDLLAESQADAIMKLDELSGKLRDAKSIAIVDEVRTSMELAAQQIDAAKTEPESALFDAVAPMQSAYGGLLRLRAREFEVTRSQQQSQGKGSASQKRKQKKLDELELDQDDSRYETQSQARENSPQEAELRETRQILSRLKDLARRQQDLNEELAQLQSALEAAKDDAEREAIERQLRRLRDQQQELLRETDELAERMQQSESESATDDQTQQKLEQTRENVREASEALDQNDASQALTSGKRAERQFEELRDEFRQQAAGQFDEAVKELREDARELEEQQKQIDEQLSPTSDNVSAASKPSDNPGLRPSDEQSNVGNAIERQRESLDELLEKMQETVAEAEEAEPLLAQKLYDSYRKAKQQRLAEKLQLADRLSERGMSREAGEANEQASQGVGELREELEQAAESVLGDESKALEQALSQLEQLDQQLQNEMQSQSGQQPSGSPSQSSGSKPSESSKPSEGAQPSENESLGKGSPGEAMPGEGSRQGQSQRGSQLADAFGGGTTSPTAANNPITGEGYREWSDALRDVEEMVGDPQLRSQAAQIRDRAREMRIDVVRHSKEPNWELVDELIATPLRELKRNVSEEWIRRSADQNANVPIDRDPVPPQFTEAVRLYYERLGSGKP